MWRLQLQNQIHLWPISGRAESETDESTASV